MRLLKIHFSSLYPDNIYLSSCRNEEITDCSISQMGMNLSDEVESFIRDNAIDSCIDRISFIGHSLGGVVIRSALQSEYMQSLKHKLYFYASLSSPHLGYLNSRSSIINTGIWII